MNDTGVDRRAEGQGSYLLICGWVNWEQAGWKRTLFYYVSFYFGIVRDYSWLQQVPVYASPGFLNLTVFT
jgi:hypothetical protein